MDTVILNGVEYEIKPLPVRKQFQIGKRLLEMVSNSSNNPNELPKILIPSFDLTIDILKIYFNLTDKQIDEITDINEVNIAIKKIQEKYPFSQSLKLSMELLTSSMTGLQGEATNLEIAG